jgi:hypothetical protein
MERTYLSKATKSRHHTKIKTGSLNQTGATSGTERIFNGTGENK